MYEHSWLASQDNVRIITYMGKTYAVRTDDTAIVYHPTFNYWHDNPCGEVELKPGPIKEKTRVEKHLEAF